MDVDLFGNTVTATPAPAEKLRRPRITNDTDLVITIVERAMSSLGYVLIGPTGQVHRKHGPHQAKKCIWWEADAVHQLLTRKWLTVGGYHLYQVGATRKAGQSVLVPKHIRLKVQRWKFLVRPSMWDMTTEESS